MLALQIVNKGEKNPSQSQMLRKAHPAHAQENHIISHNPEPSIPAVESSSSKLVLVPHFTWPNTLLGLIKLGQVLRSTEWFRCLEKGWPTHSMRATSGTWTLSEWPGQSCHIFSKNI